MHNLYLKGPYIQGMRQEAHVILYQQATIAGSIRGHAKMVLKIQKKEVTFGMMLHHPKVLRNAKKLRLTFRQGDRSWVLRFWVGLWTKTCISSLCCSAMELTEVATYRAFKALLERHMVLPD